MAGACLENQTVIGGMLAGGTFDLPTTRKEYRAIVILLATGISLIALAVNLHPA
jgi:hypothetical protein